jgi:2,3-bisphosphoglycerate-dependent phosphoglycerate mutase
LLQLYFIRHGQSTNNAFLDEADHGDYLLDRQIDPDLTPIGEKQVRMAADYLARPNNLNGFDPQNRAGFGLTHLYCSLMIRAVKTGQAIAESTGLPLVAMPEVHETGGIFSVEMVDGQKVFMGQPGPGRSFFNKEFPELILPKDLSEEGWWNREKEKRENYSLRAKSVIDGLLEAHGGKEHRVGIVMHGGIFARILTVLFDIKAENYWLLMNNCGISRVDISEDGHVMLAYMNKVDYLPADLIT